MSGSRAHTFWDVMDRHVIVHPRTGCWVWVGYRNNKGYGGRHGGAAHRWIWENRRGPIPDGLTLDHFLCNLSPPLCSTSCVNPDHLCLKTRAKNTSEARASRPLATHCKYGHPLSGENLYVKPPGNGHPTGERCCRTCRREADRRYKKNKRKPS